MDERMKAILKDAKSAQSANEVREIAAKAGVSLTSEQAESLFSTLEKTDKLTEDDLEKVSAGFYDYRYGPGPTW